MRPSLNMNPSLIIQTTYLHESDREAARRLGADLYGLLTRPASDPLAHGPGIPVYPAVEAKFVNPGAAGRVVVIPVLGAETYMMNREAAMEQISRWHRQAGKGIVIPVPHSENWRGVESQLPGKLLLSGLYGPGDRRRKVLDEIVLAVLRLLIDRDASRMRLFVSHAKADMAATGSAAKAIADHVATDRTGSAFFDATGLHAGRSLSEQLEESVSQGVFLAVRGDTYSSRSWCQRELLLAKRAGLPALTVVILKEGEAMSSAYGGNSPTVVWGGSPEPVVSRAMVECLRAEWFRQEGERIRRAAQLPEAVVLCRPPELLDLVQGPLDSRRALVAIHPDPELPVVTRGVLEAANPKLRLVTPTSVFRRVFESEAAANPFDGYQVALSLSNSPDVDGPEGFTEKHVEDATVYLARCLVSAGAGIAYGGDFRDNGYTGILSELIAAYNHTVRPAGDLLHSYLASFIDLDGVDLQITAHHLGKAPFESEAILPPPDEEPHPIPLYFSDMRRAMAEHTEARVLLGGGSLPKIEEIDQEGYGGRFPGVVEEAWWTLKRGKPLYVAGGFGGGAGVVADLLEGGDVPDLLRDETWTKHGSFRRRAEEIDADRYSGELGMPGSMEAMAEEIRAFGRDEFGGGKVDGAPLRNGLTKEENATLFWSRDPLTIASLVMKGLREVRRRKTEGTLEIELVLGSVTGAADLDAIAVATFDGIPLGGAGEAIDRAMGGRASLARSQGETLIRLESDEVAADWLYLASLGRMESAEPLPAKIESASRQTVGQALRHGFSRLGLVSYGGAVLSDLEVVTSSMLGAMKDLVGQATLVWFENDERRFDELHRLLRSRRPDAGQTDGISVSVSTRRSAEVESGDGGARRGAVLFVNVRHQGGVLDVSYLAPEGTALTGKTQAPISEGDLRRLGRGSGPRGRGTPPSSQLAPLGRRVAQLLFGADSGKLLQQCERAALWVVHDVPSSRIPFEALLADADHGELCPATGGGISRRLAVPGAPVERLFARPPAAGKLRVALVVNPTEDLPGTEREAEAIEAILAGLRDKIELCTIRRTNATREAVARELVVADILHYCGHAFYDSPDPDDSGLVLSDGKLTLADLRSSRPNVRLAFVNGCESGRVRGIPEEEFGTASFAEFFLRGGIESYLGTYWEVSDAGAAQFASTVYAGLARGEPLDAVVAEARRNLREATPPSPEWANYVLYGEGRLRLVEGRRR